MPCRCASAAYKFAPKAIKASHRPQSRSQTIGARRPSKGLVSDLLCDTLLMPDTTSRGGRPSIDNKPFASTSHDAGVLSTASQRAWLAKALAGTGAGVVACVLCSPLDVAKTRMQVLSQDSVNAAK